MQFISLLVSYVHESFYIFINFFIFFELFLFDVDNQKKLGLGASICEDFC